MQSWRLWLHLDLGHSASLGAVGPHACASLSTLVRHLPFDDAPTLALVPLPQPAPCAVAIDAPLLAEDPTVARLLPDGAGCLLVAPDACTDGAIDAARAALGTRPAWTALCASGIGSLSPREGPFDEVLLPTDACAPLLACWFYHDVTLARAGARHRDALLLCHVAAGVDDAANFGGRTLEQALRWEPFGRTPQWRRVRTKRLLAIDGPVVPAFQALLDALPRSPSGRRFAVEVLADNELDPMPGGTTPWTAYRFDWLARRAPRKRPD